MRQHGALSWLTWRVKAGPPCHHDPGSPGGCPSEAAWVTGMLHCQPPPQTRLPRCTAGRPPARAMSRVISVPISGEYAGITSLIPNKRVKSPPRSCYSCGWSESLRGDISTSCSSKHSDAAALQDLFLMLHMDSLGNQSPKIHVGMHYPRNASRQASIILLSCRSITMPT